ncbi:hypothetical protein O6H91_Y124800 [Diphasiastrum complanatum]|nr:hypothetical protein O6H91_Y124800 [Diphasiastrum complanatum]
MSTLVVIRSFNSSLSTCTIRQCITKQNALPARSHGNMWSAAGHEFYTVAQRNVITGLLGQTDVKPPTKCAVVPALLNPAGSYNKYVMDSRFSCQEAQVDEECNRYGNDQQMELFTSSNQAYENHRHRQTSVDPALTEHLYEVKQSVCQ